MGAATPNIIATDLRHTFFGELCTVMAFFLGLPSFFVSVFVVVYLTSEKQMLRITTRGVVAGMKNVLTFWNKPDI